ncbi:54S ribosomal protein L35, mitochondrial [Candida viswanathii]|uniref:Large ribosomal subunit protein mL38 n=1 Tax=Candida viswanathii TaxID=5486 RepID=A0A367XNV5_9ASCO|nr:54S ribosomal protein L35, mitochondrial [Candida viswanathii]
MFRGTISRLIQRSNSTSAKGIWSDFSKRSPTLSVQNEKIKQGLLEKIPASGPESVKHPVVKAAYHSPIAIDETFQEAYKILEDDAAHKYAKAERLEKEIQNSKDPKKIKSLEKQIEVFRVGAENRNPEVLYNSMFGEVEELDTSQLVYRLLLKERWQEYDLMKLMQRLEQHHVIPDTLPTLEPQVDVQVKFGHNVGEEFKDWVEPGAILPCFAVEHPPTLKIQEFDHEEGKNGEHGLYTVLLINPDTPDLEANSFSTTLHYALANVPLSNTDNTIDAAKLMQIGNDVVLQDYLPLTPEKNLHPARACLWVFRQDGELSRDLKVERENFDIRGFVEAHKLLPVGAHMWRQMFDRSVNAVREKYGLGKGRVYYKHRSKLPLF